MSPVVDMTGMFVILMKEESQCNKLYIFSFVLIQKNQKVKAMTP